MRRTRSTVADPADRAWLRAARPVSPSERLVMGLLAQMPAEIRGRFDDDQVEALRQAARHSQWGRHALDIRLSLPLPAWRCYLVILGGAERRSAARRQQDRRAAPGWLRIAMAAATGLVGLSDRIVRPAGLGSWLGRGRRCQRGAAPDGGR